MTLLNSLSALLSQSNFFRRNLVCFFKDYIYVDDVVSACKIILEKGNPGETYFVGTGIKTWFKEIAKIIQDLTNANIVYVDPPPYHQKIDVGNVGVDNTKLKNLGWNPTIDIESGIKNILDYFETLKPELQS